MSRPILAQLDLQALKDNLQIVRRAAPGSRVWSVVKANAYGHGIDRIWSALGATDGFALLNLEEAILLREHRLERTDPAAGRILSCAGSASAG